MVLVAKVECQASSTEAVIDGSYLLHTDESIGYATGRTRGEDLMTGYSKVVRLGPGKLYAGGTTIAAHTVERVGVAVIVERAQEGAEEWDYYADWSKFNENTDRVSSNRTLDVEGGYYYRVRCTHSANFDVSSSFTDGVFIEEP
ncbi:DUF6147 family protein [Faecalicatena contorta]|uniref:DUF6147 family protein n=1 Tax=Faecalicatena contorta TaxID=39482 RepID=UPI001F16F2E1|nr:DUF6147 family protein [Faecalicatena contorta]